MAYATTSQIQSEFKNLEVGATTSLIDSEITRFISEADAYIDAFLSKRYQTPISSSDSPLSFPIVRNISIQIVTQRCMDILKVKSGLEAADQDARGTLRDQANKTLISIVKREMDLPDAVAVLSGDGVKSYVSSNNVPFIFERGTTQW